MAKKNEAVDVPGVGWNKGKGKWRVGFSVNGKFKTFGHFENYEDARELAIYKYAMHKEQNKTNFYSSVNGITTLSILRKSGEVVPFIFDTSYYDSVSKIRWHVVKAKNTGVMYAGSCVEGEFIYLHRLVMGEPIEFEVDHINGDTLNNLKTNLRLVNRSENAQNKHRKGINNTSGVRGVYWSSKREKWIAQVGINNCTYNLGGFSSIEEADKVVTEWRINNMPFSEMDKGVA